MPCKHSRPTRRAVLANRNHREPIRVRHEPVIRPWRVFGDGGSVKQLGLWTRISYRFYPHSKGGQFLDLAIGHAIVWHWYLSPQRSHQASLVLGKSGVRLQSLFKLWLNIGSQKVHGAWGDGRGFLKDQFRCFAAFVRTLYGI